MASSLTNSQLVLNGVTLTSGNNGTIAVTSQINGLFDASQARMGLNGNISVSGKVGTVLVFSSQTGRDATINLSGSWIHLECLSGDGDSYYGGIVSSIHMSGKGGGSNEYTYKSGGLAIRIS